MIRDGIVLKDEDAQVTFNQRSFCELVKHLLVELVGISYEEASQIVERSPLAEPVADAMGVAIFSHDLPYYWAMFFYYGNGYWQKGIPAQPEDMDAYEALEKKIPIPALEDRKEWEKNTAIEDWKSQIVTLIGEPVTTTSLAALIEKEYHYKTKVLCPLEETDGLIGSQDLKVSGEEEMENALKNAQIVVADPLYHPICPVECEFYERAHIAFSGRMFLKNE